MPSKKKPKKTAGKKVARKSTGAAGKRDKASPTMKSRNEKPKPHRDAQTREAKPQPKIAAPSHQRIAEKAYELWLMRGGDEKSNWYDAERLLREGSRA